MCTHNSFSTNHFSPPKLLLEENNYFSYKSNIIEAKAVRFQDESKSHKKKKVLVKKTEWPWMLQKGTTQASFTKVVLFLGSTLVKNVTYFK